MSKCFLQVRNDEVAPIYVINLLISDLVQLCFMFTWVAPPKNRRTREIFSDIYYLGLIASVCFMVFIALERLQSLQHEASVSDQDDAWPDFMSILSFRYLVITFPLWYRFKRTIKISVMVCVVAWAGCLIYILTYRYGYFTDIISAIFFLLPLPLLIFFLGGTLKALSASRIPSDDKRRVVGVLVVVLLIYTLLFFPSVIFYASSQSFLTLPSLTLIRLSPLADLFLYIFMRKGIADKLLTSVCSCRIYNNDINDSPAWMTHLHKCCRCLAL